MNVDFNIEEQHFQYLVIQRGEVSDARKDFETWKKAYTESLAKIYENILPSLPSRAARVLDIGGGCGGINVFLHRHYNRRLHVDILDGLNDPPEVLSHVKTFNSEPVTLDFLEKNGVIHANVHWPRPPKDAKYDLIVSFAAYCFHVPPTTYFDVLRENANPGATFIFDVRNTNALWLDQLVREFGSPQLLERGKKHVRLAWTR